MKSRTTTHTNDTNGNVIRKGRTPIRIAALLALVALAATAAFSYGSFGSSFQNLLSAVGLGGSVSLANTQTEVAFDPTEAFVAPAPADTQIGIGRSGHTATLLSGSRVLLAGGSGDTSAEVYDASTGVSSSTGNLNEARSNHTATLLSDGRVLIAGGSVGNSASNSTELYDPSNGTFSVGPRMTTARSGHTATLLADGKVLITGGGTDTAEIFDGTSFTAVSGSMNASRANASAALMKDGRVFIAGGDGLNSAEIFNPADSTFTAVGNQMTIARSRSLLRVLPDGKVQIIGGGGSDVSMEVYDPSIDTIGAYAHVIPGTDTCAGLPPAIFAAPTRAALFFNGPSDPLRTGSTDPFFDRTGQTITELPNNQAVIIGGKNSSGTAFATASIVKSSPATVTTDKLDYAPGETATITGTGYQPRETVRVAIHQDPHADIERNFDVVADANGDFAGTYIVQDFDVGMRLVVSAKGLTSQWTAQTSFTDGNVKARSNASGITFTLTTREHTANQICSGAFTSGTTTGVGFSGGAVYSNGVNASNSVELIAAPFSDQGGAFIGWSGETPGDTSNPTGYTPPDARTICVPGNFTGNRNYVATYGTGVATTTSVVSSLNPSTYGQSVTFTATVARSSGTGTPTGSVQFKVDGVNFGSAVALTTVNPTTATASSSAISTLNAGAHTVTADYSPTGGFAASSGSVSQTVNKAPLTVTADNKSITYGASDPTFTFQYSGFVLSETSAVIDTPPTCSVSGAHTNAGSYPIVCSGGADNNYSFSYANGTLTVNKATLTVTADNISRGYGDANPTFTASYSGFKNGETLANSGITGSPSLTTTATPTSAAGTYTITAAVGTLASGNYSFSFANGQLTVNKASVNVKADDKSREYGDANPTFTASYSGFKNGETLATSGVTGSPSLTSAALATSGVGTFPITAAAGTLASANYDFTFTNGTLTVTAATLTITADNKSREYGDSDPTFTFQTNGFKNGETSSVLTTAPTCTSTAVASSPASSTYPITCSGGAAANYTFTYVAATLTINKATLTVKADDTSRTYGDANPAFTATFSGFKNGENLATSGVNGQPACSSTATAASTVAGGPYAITCSTGTLAAANYTFNFVDGQLTINKANLSVNADPASKVYGDTDPTVSYTLAGFKNGENLNTAGITGTASCTRTTGESVAGSPYTITCAVGTLAAPNYVFVAGTTASFTITPRPISVKADDKTKSYGESDPPLTYSVLNGNLINGDSFSGALTRAVGEDVGSYAITKGDLALSTNYNVTFTAGTLSISKATLTVTADAKTITYGDADPAFSFTYGSFKLSDNATVIDTPPTCGVSGAHSNAGTYTITCSGGVDNNYDFTYTNGTLTVDKRAATWTTNAASKTYGDADPTPLTTGSGNNFLPADSVTATYTRAPGEDAAAIPYHITATLSTTGDLNNYVVTNNGADFTINKRPVAVTADAVSKTYGNADPVLTYQVTSGSLVQGDSFTGSLSRDPGETVGQYDIKQGSLALNGNYDLSFVGAKLKIDARPLDITAGSHSKTYGDAFTFAGTEFTAGNGQLVNNDTVASITLSSTGAAANAAVGSYPIVASAAVGTGLSNYVITYHDGTLTVNARPVTVTADAKSKTYGDADPALTYQITSGTLAAGDSFTGSLTRAAGEGVGTYAITLGTVAINTNYDLQFVGALLTIDARPITVTADAQTKVYGDTDPALTYQITTGSLVAGDSFTGSLARVTGENVGAYAIQVGSLALNSNYALTFAGADLTITARPVTVTANAQSKVYGDADPSLSYAITTGSLVNSDGFTGALARDTGENVGTYAITQGTLTLGGNYNLTFVGANLTIQARAITVTADAKSKTYGDADPALTYQLTIGSLVNGDTFSGSLTRVTGEAVGSYAIQLGSLSLSTNYVITYAGADLTITKRAVTITADAKSKTYGEADPALTFQVTNGSLAFSDAFTGSLARTAGENVGAYPINQGDVSLGSNYDLTFVAADLTINKRAITVTADAKTKVYGDAEPALTYQVTVGTVVNGDTFTGALVRMAGENVGTYAIVQGTLALNGNYDLTFGGANLVITQRSASVTPDAAAKAYGSADPSLTGNLAGFLPADGVTASYGRTSGENVGSYTISATLSPAGVLGNYNINYNTAVFTINKADLTVTVDDKTRTYGDANPAFTGTVTGVTNGDNINASYSTAATPASPVGNYEIGATINDPGSRLGNYNVTVHNGTLSVTARTLNITAGNQSKTYGSAFTFAGTEFTTGAGELANGDTVNTVTLTSAGAPATAAAGSYAITATAPVGTNLSNYAISFHDGTLTVNRAALQVTASSHTVTYGDAAPAITASYVGFVNEDAASGLAPEPSCGTTYTAGSPVTTYPSACSGAASPNYDISYVAGVVTITKREATWTTNNSGKTYGDLDPSPVTTGSGSNFVPGDGVTAVYTRSGGENVGTYHITATLSSATAGALDNYTITNTGADFVVSQRAATVEANPKSRIYGEANPTLDATVTGTANGDVLNYTLSSTADTASAVGSYPIAVALGSNPNYSVTPVNSTLAVTARSVTITADAKTKTYGDADPALTYQITGGSLVNGDSFSGVLNRAAGETVGNYAILQNTVALSGNYDLHYVGADLTIGKRNATWTTDAKTKVYGDADPSFTGGGDFRSEDGVTATYSRAAGETVAGGPYHITATLSSSVAGALDNYNVTNNGADLTITKRQATWTTNNNSKTYLANEPNPLTTGLGSNFMPADNITATYTRASGEPVGNYHITTTLSPSTVLANYGITNTGATFNIGNTKPSDLVVNGMAINENGTATVSGSFVDPDPNQPHTVTVVWNDGGATSTVTVAAGTFTFSAPHTYLDDNPSATASDPYSVSVNVSDGPDNVSGGTTVTVNNVAPVITAANSSPIAPQALGTLTTVTANFTDVGTKDTHTCLINWDDNGATSSGTVTQGLGSGSCSATRTFANPGVYSVTVKVADDDNGSSQAAIQQSYVVVYDPNAGFVTGGGWIMSPAGACKLDWCTDATVGKANFGFVSKYKKGSSTPDGQTEFQFQAGNLNFHSSAYDVGSLVVSGYKAQYKGTGDINGVTGYRFVLTAYDGNVSGGGGVDKFRMKIIRVSDNKVVYDNVWGASDDIDTANPLAIAGGSINIQKN